MDIVKYWDGKDSIEIQSWNIVYGFQAMIIV